MAHDVLDASYQVEKFTLGITKIVKLLGSQGPSKREVAIVQLIGGIDGATICGVLGKKGESSTNLTLVLPLGSTISILPGGLEDVAGDIVKRFVLPLIFLDGRPIIVVVTAYLFGQVLYVTIYKAALEFFDKAEEDGGHHADDIFILGLGQLLGTAGHLRLRRGLAVVGCLEQIRTDALPRRFVGYDRAVGAIGQTVVMLEEHTDRMSGLGLGEELGGRWELIGEDHGRTRQLAMKK